jgi:hypothetical protein
MLYIQRLETKLLTTTTDDDDAYGGDPKKKRCGEREKRERATNKQSIGQEE